ncbi:TPR repeat-containing protein [Caballeronia temeraria]|uniref:TPR repeat-containing protein n=1 Tax=Caballeronia temeraria TaxID=1777137 RepID=A0A158CGF9_9BURK|nr:tetratricopeptide repeat-containing glycosyltransferase family protein [Caballeronia temeraria]SAK81468.1 TPR repeat-containing protein [Caballeronia temeraria]
MTHVDACLSQCIGIEERSQALLLKGNIAQLMKRHPDAAACFEQVAQAFPSAWLYNVLSGTLISCGEFERAAAAARAGLALPAEQDSSDTTKGLLTNLSDALYRGKAYPEAKEAFRQLLRLTPDNFAARNNLGFILQQLDQVDAAIEQMQHAVRLRPSSSQCRNTLACALLLAGRYEEAWPHFEHRWAGLKSPSGESATMPTLPIQQWDGAFDNSSGQHLLVLAEQGFGDSLQFCRYLPMVLERFAKVGFVCPKPLRRLLAHSLGTRWPNLVLLDDVPSDFWQWDRYIFTMSMPMAFRTTLDTIPAAIPYLEAERRAAQQFTSRLEKLERPSLPRIGLVWAGGHSFMDIDQLRSISADQVDPLICWPRARWVSLQKPEIEEKRLKPEQRELVVDWMDEMKDFADTAALISCLDLVISVDTSVAHLAAAMGKPVWLLNRFAGCWRWLRNREDSPWYPSVRIFTQKERGNWDEVLERVVNALEHHDFRRDANV